MRSINSVLMAFSLAILAGCSTAPRVSLETQSQPLGKGKQQGLPSAYTCNYNPNSKAGGSFYKTDGPLEIPMGINNVLEPVPMFEHLHKWANKPYNRLGQDFVPLAQPGNFSQKGIGTWYGRRYHGQNTSSGEAYDMFQMTAASPILPIPSYARVTNLKNRRSVVVRINDRGPFLKGRIIDLSFLAACRLGYATQGSTEVEVVSLNPEQ
jgi:rare lipoprotein A